MYKDHIQLLQKILCVGNQEIHKNFSQETFWKGTTWNKEKETLR
jgi:hypothetical protein